ncbi:MAG: ABC transporter ATP-binding protein, partial [Clostridia bacterium]|nr:ABC transporter ATP-binding protein [Clostridia bacterium]
VIGSLFGFIYGTWLTRYIFNSIQLEIPFEKIVRVVVAVFIAQSVFWLVSAALHNIKRPIWRLRVTKAINRKLFSKVARVDLSCYEDTEFYKKFTMTVPEAMGGVEDYVIELVDDALSEITSLVTHASIVLIIDPVLIALAFIPLISNLIFGKKMNRIQYDYQMQMREIKRDKDYVDRVFYLGDYAKEVRMTNIHKVMMRRFYDDLRETQKRTGKFGFKTARFMFFKTFIDGTLVYYAGIFYAAFRLLVSHTMLVGDAIVLSSAISYVSHSLGWVTSTYVKMNQHAMFLEKLRGFIDYDIKIKQLPDAPKPDRGNAVIEFRNVSFCYGGTDKEVLKNVDLTVNPGEKIAVVGVNGAGKSTLVKLMMRLYDVTDGCISCGGEDIRTLDLEAYRDLYGVIFQDHRIFAMSVRDNVLLGREGDDEKVINALKAAGVYEKIMSLPNGIDTMLTREYDEEGTVLSGGEYQKICIARVFAADSPIVILDEPSSALDPIAEYEMYQNMLEACRDRTAVFISHRLSSAVLADRVVMIEDGRVIEDGSHAELMERGGKYADMFAKQAENYAEGGDERGE